MVQKIQMKKGRDVFWLEYPKISQSGISPFIWRFFFILHLIIELKDKYLSCLEFLGVCAGSNECCVFEMNGLV